MREQLIQYVELLFAGAQDCEEIQQEILQNTLDRYDDLIAEGKVPEAASADVYAVLSNTPNRLDLDTMSGDLDITLPADAGFALSIDAASSDFESDFETTNKNGNYVCGDGRCRINVSALSGDVIIRKGETA